MNYYVYNTRQTVFYYGVNSGRSLDPAQLKPPNDDVGGYARLREPAHCIVAVVELHRPAVSDRVRGL